MSRLHYLLAIVLLLSCKKEEKKLPTEEVHGVLLHSITQQPIINHLIQLEVSRRYISDQKNLEFPNGIPVTESKSYLTTTDVNGRYTFNFEVYPNSWFWVHLPKERYYVVKPIDFGFILSDDMKPMRDFLRSNYDTILADRSGYIRYHIQHTTGYENEQLYVKTPYRNSTNRPPDFGLRPFPEYNWLFLGNTNQVLLDTIPAESITSIPIEWLHYLTDTLKYRKDSIQVSVGAIKDYNIIY